MSRRVLREKEEGRRSELARSVVNWHGFRFHRPPTSLSGRTVVGISSSVCADKHGSGARPVLGVCVLGPVLCKNSRRKRRAWQVEPKLPAHSNCPSHICITHGKRFESGPFLLVGCRPQRRRECSDRDVTPRRTRLTGSTRFISFQQLLGLYRYARAARS